MSRRMSCSMTIDAVKERRKTVTRRHVDTWKNLRPGDRLILIEKGMGLPAGSKQVVLAEVEIVDVRVEPIGFVTSNECVREGLSHMTPSEFVAFWCRGHGAPIPLTRRDSLEVLCRRIEWRYLDDSPQEMVRVEQAVTS